MTDLAFQSQRDAAARPRFRIMNVIALTKGPAAERRVAEALSDRDQFAVHTVRSEDIDFIAAAARAGQADLIVIDADLSDLAAGPAIERLVAGVYKGVPALVFADALSPDATRRLMRMGVSEVLDAQTPAADVGEAALKAVGARKSATGTRLSAVFSPRGGVGVSTIAVELAMACAQSLPAHASGACLIDLNFQFGVCASLLNVEPRLNIAAGALEPKRVDAQLLDAFLTRHPSGLHVLATPPGWRPVHVPVEGVACLLDVAAERFDHLIIDLPHDLGPACEAVLAHVDDLFIVSDLSVPGLQLMRDAMLNLESRMRPGAQPTLILNRVPRQSKGGSLTLNDVRRVINGERTFVIYDDALAAAEASDRGDAILRVASDSRLAKEILAAIGSALPTGRESAADERRKSGLFNLMRAR